MKFSDIPAKFPIPFGNDAGPGFIRPIPVESQIGINNGFASLTDGFPPLNAQPVAAGGIPPFEQDMNGILLQTTAWARWFGAGGPVKFDPDLAADPDFGGYPAGAVVMSNIVLGNMFMSTADNNISDPDSIPTTNWVVAPGTLGTSALVTSMSNVVPYGFVPANGLTIGSAASNGTNRGNADTWPLFSFFWNTFSNTACPVYTSAGVPSTRGANAAADFAANKAIGVFSMLCSKFGGVDGMGGTPIGGYTGVPFASGNASTPGSIAGANLHALTLAENGPHTHAISITGSTGSESVVHTHTFSGTTSGESNTHVHDYATPNYGASLQSGGTPSTASAIHAFTDVNSSDHTHTYSGTTSAESPLHTHIYNVTGNTGSSGTGTGHNTVDKTALGFWLWKL